MLILSPDGCSLGSNMVFSIEDIHECWAVLREGPLNEEIKYC